MRERGPGCVEGGDFLRLSDRDPAWQPCRLLLENMGANSLRLLLWGIWHAVRTDLPFGALSWRTDSAGCRIAVAVLCVLRASPARSRVAAGGD